MEARKEKIMNKKDLIGQLIGLVEKLRGDLALTQNARNLRELTVDTNEDIVKVSLDKNIANPSNVQMEVLQLAQKSSAMSSGFSDKDESYVGVGFIRFNMPDGSEREIYVDSDNSSLTGIAKLINRDTENGMRANVINDGSDSDAPWRLIMSLEDTGDGNKAEFPYFYFVDGEDDFYVEFEREARDAKIKVDGFEIELSENQAKDIIPGVTIDLKKAKPGEEFSINISEDSEAITGKINGIVEKINDVLKFIHKQNTLDEKSDTSRTLGGDLILQTLESRLRGVIFKDVSTTFGTKRFGNLGVSFQRDGNLKLEQKKFDAVTSENYKMVSEVLTGRYSEEEGKVLGFLGHLDHITNQLLQFPNGLLQSRNKGLQSNIDQIDRRIVNKERMISQKEQNLKQRFARLEGMISKIKSSGAGLQGLATSVPNPTQLG